ncbi:CRISPR-associated protein Cas4 [Nocardia nova]|uniref:CRISPR-associated protein Cas4 n=1 Tax=Nocardia nova TaxID=37330 RepID=UPI001C43A50D|nr:CRISPR-associated protein Cas4 [Nocardia nova]MBV7706461.1 CRISPR-associated protein Cas4 [Nocardia nova]
MPLSALEHYAYCPRQALLIWQEAYFESNTDTVRGDLAHEAVDRGGTLTGRDGARIWRSFPVHSNDIGMHGVCDTVHVTGDGLVPIEHKSGRHQRGGPAELQVAAQVLCLREMFEEPVPHGELFVGRNRRRHVVVVDSRLIAAVHEAVDRLRSLIVQSTLPPPVFDKRCDRCSLRPGCLPETARRASIDLFAARPIRDCE